MFFNSEIEGRLSFDLVSNSYDLYRPEYPIEIFEDIIAYSGIKNNSKILDIVAGSGQATVFFLDNKYNTDIIEPGNNLMNILKGKFKNCDNVKFIKEFFENAELEENRYNLVFAGNSFHWIDKEIGIKKLQIILKPNGCFSASWNLPNLDKKLVSEIENITYNYLDDYVVSTWSSEIDDLFVHGFEDFKNNYNFTDCELKKYQRKKSYSAKDFVYFLDSYSNFAELESKPKAELFQKIENLIINNYNGVVEYQDKLWLVLAKNKA